LIFCADESFPLHYVQVVKGVRPDVTMHATYIADGELKLYKRGPDIMQSLYQNLTVGGLLKSTTEPVFITHCNRKYAAMGFKIQPMGFTYRLALDEKVFSWEISQSPSKLEADLDTIMETSPTSDYWMMKHRLRVAKMLLSYLHNTRKIDDQGLRRLIEKYHLQADVKFLAALAAEFALGQDFERAAQFFNDVGPKRLHEIDLEDAEVFCRLLLIKEDNMSARPVCLFVQNNAPDCNADANYNLALAFWEEKQASIQYFEQAARCAPQSETIRTALERRRNAP
jgi:hypothetical protein